jgi:hypothetical protein
MKLDPSSVRALEKVLVDEVGACEEYLQLVAREQAHIVKFEHESVGLLAEKRAIVSERMAMLRDKRLEIVATIGGDKSLTVTQLVTQGCVPADKKRLLALVQKLRAKVDQVEDKSREFTQVVDFTLGLVNGSISILWSATQNVNKCYNAFGGLTQSFQPAPQRDGSLLGKA